MKHTNNFQFSIFNFQFIIVLASTMMLTSCVNDLPYDAEAGAPKLVLNALLTPDGEQLTATVGRTVHFLDTEEPPRLSNAIVTATINGEEHSLSYDAATQKYLSYYGLNSGDEVTLTATHTLGTASATQRVVHPTPIHITHVATQPFTNPGDPVSLATLNDVDSALLVSLYIDDPIEEANYYRLTIDYEGSYEVNWDEGGYMTSPTPSQGGELNTAIAESPLLGRGRGEAFYPHYLLTESSSRLLIDSESASQLLGSLLYMTSYNSFIFSDEQLRNEDGQPVIDLLMLLESPASHYNDMFDPESGWTDGNIWGDEDYIYPADTVSHATYHYSFTLETFSEDYYRYLQSVSSYEILGGTFVGEPTPIHSNIRGGLGIVGSYGTAPCIGDSLRYELKVEN